MNLLNLTNKVEVLEELKKGNTDVLKDMPPVQAMQYGLLLQNEVGQVEESPINEEAVNKAMLDRMADSGVKEALLKRIEQEEKERAVKVEKSKAQAEQKEVKQQEPKQIESVDQLAEQLNKLLNNQ